MTTTPMPQRKMPVWAAVIISISFGALAVGTGIGTLLLFGAISAANGAPQEAAAGAIFASFFIAGYIIVRSIEKAVRALARY